MTKKLISIFLLVLLVLSLGGCKKENENASVTAGNTNPTTLRVGFCPGPYSEMWRTAIAPQLEAEGYQFEYIEFSDYVQPNNALANNEIDVNLFQHSIYLKNFSTEHNLDLSLVTEVPTAGMGIWSNTTASLDEVVDGATVTIPNDETNQARGLRVLESAGLITLKADADKAKAIPDDIDQNPHNLKIVPMEAAQLPRTLDSADLGVINGNFAISAGLDFSEVLYQEVLAEGYVNVIAVRTEDNDAQFVADIKAAATSDTFKSTIEEPSGKFYTFQKPVGW
ncbi:MetQ/NlpA family ABC transporter substrate-binding protein [Anaerotignum sp. MB30-C6]|uniref:MetQ/NlpA family ABC transporter substrate-binding protein n=1 Tax=Anaerotignum sp. MB30-C6 TaxID=3070814 RepID=UPI0027DB5731|nr:MetQ/NlpA family ABC transporter substrate-binding protein [Anaerotignum sp. MB30-C6]WMI80056.1 MetQ/NlpA family ABC transporter substrate-binding protein [Anaerotignum sp. MB30-C6]